MKTTKILICVMITLTASFLLPPMVNASTANISIASLSSSGTIIARDTSPMNLNGAIILYGATTLSSSQISYLASHFNMIISDFFLSQSAIASLKAANPNIIVLGYCDGIGVNAAYSYWSTVNANENWFLHTTSGNRIKHSGWGWYLMDISSSGWRQFYTSHINSQLSGTLFDGVFVDDVWDQLLTGDGKLYFGAMVDAQTGVTLTGSAVSGSILSNWHSNMVGFLQYVKTNIVSGMKVLPNTNEYLTNDYLNAADGRMDEGFAYINYAWPVDYYNNALWFKPIDHINAMARDSATGKIIMAVNGALIPNNPDSNTLAKVAQNVNYCLAATLLATNGANCYFSYNNGVAYDYNSGIAYMPNMVNLGSPSGPYYYSQNVYIRNFASGIVLFNPSNNPYQIVLGQNYYLADGTMVSNIVLGSWSGQFLLSSP
jgi:hypothetical protein